MNNIITNLKKTFAMVMGTVVAFTGAVISNSYINNVYAYAESANVALYEEMLEQVNEYRAKEITELFSHTRPDGRKSSTVFEDFNVQKQYCGENIAYHYKKSMAIVMDASDVSQTLQIYSQMASGKTPDVDINTFLSADVNNDEIVDASDASSIM